MVGCWFFIAGATVINAIHPAPVQGVRFQLALNFYIPCALALCTMVKSSSWDSKSCRTSWCARAVGTLKRCVTVNQLLAEPNYEDAGRTISHYCTYRNPGDYLASSDGRDIRIAANLVEKLAVLSPICTFSASPLSGIPTLWKCGISSTNLSA